MHMVLKLTGELLPLWMLMSPVFRPLQRSVPLIYMLHLLLWERKLYICLLRGTINKYMNISTNRTQSVNHLINWLIYQSNDWLNNQLINQPVNQLLELSVSQSVGRTWRYSCQMLYNKRFFPHSINISIIARERVLSCSFILISLYQYHLYQRWHNLTLISCYWVTPTLSQPYHII